MLEAIFFDHDGTMAPSMERQEAWFKHYSALHSVEWPFETFEEFLGNYNLLVNDMGVQSVYDMLQLPCDMEDKNHPVWAEYTDFVTKNPIQLYEGIPETLHEIFHMGTLPENPLQNKRLRIGVNTSNSWQNCRSDLLAAGVLRYFDTQVTRDELEYYQGLGKTEAVKKPSKISVARTLDYLDSAAAHTMHVCDTLNDLRASIAVVDKHRRGENLITVGVTWGYEKEEDLRAGVEIGGERYHFTHIVNAAPQIADLVRTYIMK